MPALSASNKKALMMAFSVFVCVISLIGIILSAVAVDRGDIYYDRENKVDNRVDPPDSSNIFFNNRNFSREEERIIEEGLQHGGEISIADEEEYRKYHPAISDSSNSYTYDVAQQHQYIYSGIQSANNNSESGFVLKNSSHPEWVLMPKYVLQIGPECLSRSLWNNLRKPHVRVSICKQQNNLRFVDIREFRLFRDRISNEMTLKATTKGLKLSRLQVVSLLRYRDWVDNWMFPLNLDPNVPDFGQ